MQQRRFSFDESVMDAAYNEAKINFDNNAIPIGAALHYDDGKTSQVFRGRNQRLVAPGSNVLHAETHCLEVVGSRSPEWFQHTTLFTTLFPCTMCSGAAALFGIPRIVIGEDRNFPIADADRRMGRAFLAYYGIEFSVLNEDRCIDMLAEYIEKNPEEWFKDVPGYVARERRSNQ